MTDDQHARQRQLIGVAFMCVGVFAFTFQDLIIKGISGVYPAHEIVFIRTFLSLPFTLVIAHFVIDAVSFVGYVYLHDRVSWI